MTLDLFEFFDLVSFPGDKTASGQIAIVLVMFAFLMRIVKELSKNLPLLQKFQETAKFLRF